MARKSITQLQQELREQVRYANPFGNIGPDTTLTLIIYARQSSTRQFVENVYSAEQQRDGLLKYAKDTLHWQGPIKLLIENELAKRTSGTLPTDDRPGLIVVLEYVESGECSAVLSVDVSRLFRDESAIEAAVFAGTCKDHKVAVITLSDYYDFNNPTRKDTSRFIGKAMEAGNWITEHVKGKMLPGRLSKAEKGLVANGIAPIGMQLVQVGDREKDVTLTASPHAPNVNALYKRFHELGADLTALHNEILGKPIFPDHPDIDPATIRLTRVPGGWTIKNRSGLRHILTNPAYVGHLQFNGAIVKYNAWEPIVSQSLWDFADSHLSKYDVSGNEYERAPRQARYIKNTEDYGALLYGVRANGSPVIDGISGQHVYVQIGKQVKTGKRKAGYVIKDHSQMNTSFYVASIDVRELDSIIESHLLDRLKREQETAAKFRAMPKIDGYTTTIISPMDDAIEQVEGEQPVKPETRLQRTINEAEIALKRITRRLATSEDVMTDVEVRQNYADKAKLTRQLDELTRKQKQEELTAQSIEQGKEDILTANEMWYKWPIDRKRRLVQILTTGISLECIADGWLRLTITWSPVIFASMTITIESVAYLWRDSVRHWTTAEENTLRAMYTSATRDELLHALSHRSWQSIKDKASSLKLPRHRYESHSLPDYMSISDMGVAVEFGLDVSTGARLWWFMEESSQSDGLS
jgi:Resolvase, N terminal domain/Recombinase